MGIDNTNYLSCETNELDNRYLINTFEELRLIVAELSCLHPDSILFFRGQTLDHTREYGQQEKASTCLPSIYRDKPSPKELQFRWEKLELATKLLKEGITTNKNSSKEEFKFLKQKKLAQWSVLQHYEVVKTPLLDVTQSLRVACSFASLDNNTKYGYIYVIALPYPTGRISINSEHELTNIRLLSVVPSNVRRPHFQEGFLVGEDELHFTPKVSDEFDFRRRIVAKFKINLGNPKFWSIVEETPDRPLTRLELYPDEIKDEDDWLSKLCKSIKDRIKNNSDKNVANSDKTKEFFRLWGLIELYMMAYSKEMSASKQPTLVNGMKTLKYHNKDNEQIGKLLKYLNDLKDLRNLLAHGRTSVNITEMIFRASEIINSIEENVPRIKEMVFSYQEKQREKE